MCGGVSPWAPSRVAADHRAALGAIAGGAMQSAGGRIRPAKKSAIGRRIVRVGSG
jgi:hypothetical protein